MRVKPEPESFSTYDEIVQKYDLKKNWLMYSNITPPKRGGRRESFSDAKNIFIRASLDKIFSAEGSLREAWSVVVAMFNGGCYICGQPIYNSLGQLLPGITVQADHIIPPSAGGTISAGNMAPAHSACNDLKGDEDVEVFLKEHPERLQKIRDFQQMYSYKAPDLELFKDTLVEISEIWDSIVSKVNVISVNTRAELDERIARSIITDDEETYTADEDDEPAEEILIISEDL